MDSPVAVVLSVPVVKLLPEPAVIKLLTAVVPVVVAMVNWSFFSTRLPVRTFLVVSLGGVTQK